MRLIQNVIGADGDNVIVGDANDNVMSGGPGVDDIEGRGGADILSGLGGDDTLIAGNDPGDDADGGDGVDTCQATSTIACELSPTEAAGWRNSRSRGVAGG